MRTTTCTTIVPQMNECERIFFAVACVCMGAFGSRVLRTNYVSVINFHRTQTHAATHTHTRAHTQRQALRNEGEKKKKKKTDGEDEKKMSMKEKWRYDRCRAARARSFSLSHSLPGSICHAQSFYVMRWNDNKFVLCFTANLIQNILIKRKQIQFAFGISLIIQMHRFSISVLTFVQ